MTFDDYGDEDEDTTPAPLLPDRVWPVPHVRPDPDNPDVSHPMWVEEDPFTARSAMPFYRWRDATGLTGPWTDQLAKAELDTQQFEAARDMELRARAWEEFRRRNTSPQLDGVVRRLGLHEDAIPSSDPGWSIPVADRQIDTWYDADHDAVMISLLDAASQTAPPTSPTLREGTGDVVRTLQTLVGELTDEGVNIGFIPTDKRRARLYAKWLMRFGYVPDPTERDIHKWVPAPPETTPEDRAEIARQLLRRINLLKIPKRYEDGDPTMYGQFDYPFPPSTVPAWGQHPATDRPQPITYDPAYYGDEEEEEEERRNAEFRQSFATNQANREAAFRRAIAKNPLELTGHDALADWYGEHDRPDDEAFRRAISEGIVRRMNTPWGMPPLGDEREDGLRMVRGAAPQGSRFTPTARLYVPQEGYDHVLTMQPAWEGTDGPNWTGMWRWARPSWDHTETTDPSLGGEDEEWHLRTLLGLPSGFPLPPRRLGNFSIRHGGPEHHLTWPERLYFGYHDINSVDPQQLAEHWPAVEDMFWENWNRGKQTDWPELQQFDDQDNPTDYAHRIPAAGVPEDQWVTQGDWVDPEDLVTPLHPTPPGLAWSVANEHSWSDAGSDPRVRFEDHRRKADLFRQVADQFHAAGDAHGAEIARRLSAQAQALTQQYRARFLREGGNPRHLPEFQLPQGPDWGAHYPNPDDPYAAPHGGMYRFGHFEQLPLAGLSVAGENSPARGDFENQLRDWLEFRALLNGTATPPPEEGVGPDIPIDDIPPLDQTGPDEFAHLWQDEGIGYALNYGDREEFEKSIAKDPTNPDSHLAMADWLQDNDDPDWPVRQAIGEGLRRRFADPHRPTNYAGPEDILPMLKSIHPVAWRGKHALGHSPEPEWTPRLVAADLMDDLDRPRSAAILRDLRRFARPTALDPNFPFVVDAGTPNQIPHAGANRRAWFDSLDPFTRAYMFRLMEQDVDAIGEGTEDGEPWNPSMMGEGTIQSVLADTDIWRLLEDKYPYIDDMEYRTKYPNRWFDEQTSEGEGLASARGGHNGSWGLLSFNPANHFNENEQHRMSRRGRSFGSFPLRIDPDAGFGNDIAGPYQPPVIPDELPEGYADHHRPLSYSNWGDIDDDWLDEDDGDGHSRRSGVWYGSDMEGEDEDPVEPPVYLPGQRMPDGGTYEPDAEPDLGEFIANKFRDDYGDPDFGIDPRVGYLLKNGYGVPMGPDKRYEDHRGAIPTSDAMRRWGWPEDVIRDYEQASRGTALRELMRRSGAVRLMPEGGDLIVDHMQPLTHSQRRAILEYVKQYQPPYVVVRTPDGNEVELENPTPGQVARALEHGLQ